MLCIAGFCSECLQVYQTRQPCTEEPHISAVSRFFIARFKVRFRAVITASYSLPFSLTRGNPSIMSKQWIPNSSSIKRETWKPTSSWSPATATHSQPAAPQAGPSTSKRPRSPRRRSYSPDPPSRPAQTGSTGRSDANDIQSDDRGSRSYRPDDKGFKKDDKEERSWSAWNSKVGRDDRERERRGVSPERVRGRERERERDRDRSRSRSRSMDREKDKEVGRSGPRDSGGRRDISGRAKENGWRKGVKDEGRSWSAWNSRVEGLKKEDDRSIDKRNEKIGQSYRPAPDRTPSPPLKVKRDRSPDHGAVRYRRESPDYGVGGRGRGRRDSPDYAKGSVEMRERSQDRDPCAFHFFPFHIQLMMHFRQSSSSRRQRSPTPPSKGVADRKRDPPSPRLSEAKRPRDTSPARSHVSSRQRSRSRSRNRRRSPSKSPPPPSRPVADRWRLPKDRDREQEREKPLSPPHSQRHWSPNRTTEPSDSPTKSTLASQFEMFRSEAQVWRRDPVEESVPGNRNQSGSTASQDHPSAFQARSSWESRRAEPNGNLPGWNRPQPDQTSRQRVWGQPGPASVPNGQHNLSASQSPSMSVNGYSRQSGSATSSQLDHGRVHTDTFERSSSPVKAGWKKIAAPSNPTFQSPDTRDLLVETKRFDSDVSGEAEMEIDEPQSTDSWSGAVKADQVRKDTTAATEAQYSAHLSTIAPYIQAAFTQWYAQNAEPGLSQFLVHYFGRAPDQKELSQIEQLLTLRREINRNQQGGQTNGTPSHVTPIAEKGRTILTDQHDINGSASTPSQASVLGPSTTSPADSQPSRPSKAASGSATETYERLICVGEGTYGKVYKARDNETREIVALKRIRMEGEKDGFPVTAMREIKLLQGLRHENVIRLNEMMVSKGILLSMLRGIRC